MWQLGSKKEKLSSKTDIWSLFMISYKDMHFLKKTWGLISDELCCLKQYAALGYLTELNYLFVQMWSWNAVRCLPSMMGPMCNPGLNSWLGRWVFLAWTILLEDQIAPAASFSFWLVLIGWQAAKQTEKNKFTYTRKPASGGSPSQKNISNRDGTCLLSLDHYVQVAEQTI